MTVNFCSVSSSLLLLMYRSIWGSWVNYFPQWGKLFHWEHNQSSQRSQTVVRPDLGIGHENYTLFSSDADVHCVYMYLYQTQQSGFSLKNLIVKWSLYILIPRSLAVKWYLICWNIISVLWFIPNLIIVNI